MVVAALRAWKTRRIGTSLAMRLFCSRPAKGGRKMEKLIRKIDLRGLRGQKALNELQKQWLLTNGLGGYASGTIAGSVTWRYHGLLIAALPAPLGRMLMFNHLAESIQCDNNVVEIGGAEPQGPD